MSDKLPVVSGDMMIRFLEKYGFKRDRQQGSHIILVKRGTEDGDIIEIVVPRHKELSVGVTLNNLKSAGIHRDEFIAAMRKKR